MKKQHQVKKQMKKRPLKLNGVDKATSLYQLCRANRHMKAVEVVRAVDAMFPGLLQCAKANAGKTEQKKREIAFFEYSLKNGKLNVRKGAVPYEKIAGVYNKAVSTGNFTEVDKILDEYKSKEYTLPKNAAIPKNDALPKKGNDSKKKEVRGKKPSHCKCASK